jgi:S-formylglutathione hydrolase FrmB
MKKLLFSLLIVLTIISCENTQPKIAIIESSSLPSADSVLIVTPENYKPTNNYPLVILLHGWSGNYLQWNSILELQDYANAYNFIIACPDGFYDSWYLNNPQKPQLQFEDFFWNDFIVYLTNNYSVDSTNIFISGLSMGGHGAMTLFLKNPDFFKSAGSTSGILDLTFFPDRWSIKNGIGSIITYPDIWKQSSAFFLLDSLKNKEKKIIVDCGIEDFAYQVNLNFVKKCYDLGLNVNFLSLPGAHNREHWKYMLPKHFEFFYNQIKR